MASLLLNWNKGKIGLSMLLLGSAIQTAPAIQTPSGFAVATGDLSVVIHWDPNTDLNLAGYRVYRSTAGSGGPFSLVTPSLLLTPGYCDISGNVVNGQTNYYEVSAVDSTANESLPSAPLPAIPQTFASNDQFLDYVQQTCFDYFWYAANPVNGMIPDRSANGSPCSIASVGFGLSAIAIAIDHGWITRSQGVARVTATLNTFYQGPQGPGTSGVIGYHGWFYHFLDMNSALRSGTSELSSIDTALLLAGILHVRQYFDGTNADETAIRTLAEGIFNRVDWTWMAQGTGAVAMGWQPTTGFSGYGNWVGYNEGMILYLLGLGTATNPLPATAWNVWTSGYTWQTNYGQAYVPFPPLFGHEYSHCWIDFRHVADAYMNGRNATYFLNSRRASLAEVFYSIANPMNHVGYSSNVWGLTASDGPSGYSVHGLPPAGFDDGTIAPTAAGGAMAFTPEYSLPTLLYFYSHFRPRIWTALSFRDAFNLGQGWYDTDELGIDQGPIIIMIENYRTQRPWKFFMQNEEVQRGLQRAGFVSLPFMNPTIAVVPDQASISLSWSAQSGRTYQVEYSPDLIAWFASPTGEVLASGPVANWTDAGPPATLATPFSVDHRFYRVFQYGTP